MNPTPSSAAEADILDIYVPEVPPNYWLMAAWIVGAAVAIAAIAWALVYFIRQDQRRRQREASPQKIALSRLARLESEAAGMSPNQFSLRLSDIVKDYLHARFGDRFRFETAEEFLARVSDTRVTALPMTTRESLAGFIGLCEELKFGRPGDAAERCGPLLEASRQIFRESPSGATQVHAPAGSLSATASTPRKDATTSATTR